MSAAPLLPGVLALVAVLPLLPVLLVVDPDVVGASADAGMGALRPWPLLLAVLGPRPDTEVLPLLFNPLFVPSLNANARVQHCQSMLQPSATTQIQYAPQQ